MESELLTNKILENGSSNSEQIESESSSNEIFFNTAVSEID